MCAVLLSYSLHDTVTLHTCVRCFIVLCAMATLYLNSHVSKAILHFERERERKKESEREREREMRYRQ